MSRAQQWRRQNEEVTFPSGKVALLKRVNVLSMVTSDGSIPDTFYTSMFVNNGKPSEGGERAYFETFLNLAAQVARAAFVSPRIVDVPNDEADEIGIDDVDDADKMFLMNWMMYGGAPVDALRRFRQHQQKRGVDTASDV